MTATTLAMAIPRGRVLSGHARESKAGAQHNAAAATMVSVATPGSERVAWNAAMPSRYTDCFIASAATQTRFAVTASTESRARR